MQRSGALPHVCQGMYVPRPCLLRQRRVPLTPAKRLKCIRPTQAAAADAVQDLQDARSYGNTDSSRHALPSAARTNSFEASLCKRLFRPHASKPDCRTQPGHKERFLCMTPGRTPRKIHTRRASLRACVGSTRSRRSSLGCLRSSAAACGSVHWHSPVSQPAALSSRSRRQGSLDGVISDNNFLCLYLLHALRRIPMSCASVTGVFHRGC